MNSTSQDNYLYEMVSLAPSRRRGGGGICSVSREDGIR